jgi:uncharacterized membrane protein YfcA
MIEVTQALSNPAFLVAASTAVLLAGISKAGLAGGLGGLSVPLLALTVGPNQALAIMLPILLLLDSIGLWVFRRTFRRDILKLLLPGAVLGSLVGWLLFRHIDEALIKAVIGVESIVFALLKLAEGSSAWAGEPRDPNPARARFWSAVSGFTSFVSHAGGPPLMQFMLPLRLAPAAFAGTVTYYFAVVNLIKVVPYAQLDLWSRQTLYASAGLLVLVPVGYFIGLRFLKRVSPALFVKISIAGLLITGIKLCTDAWVAYR